MNTDQSRQMRHLFRAFIPASIIGLALSEFTLVFLCCLGGSWLAGCLLNPYPDIHVFIFDEGGLIRICLVVACLALGLYFQNLYTDVRVKSITLLVRQICLVIGLAFLFQAFLAYIRRPEWSLPRWAMIFGGTLALMVIPAWRLFYSRVILKATGFQRVLFPGGSPVSQEIAAHLAARPEVGMRVLAGFDVAEALAVSELSETHRQILIPTGQTTAVTVTAAARHTLLEFNVREVRDQLRENGSTSVHPPWSANAAADRRFHFFRFFPDFSSNRF